MQPRYGLRRQGSQPPDAGLFEAWRTVGYTTQEKRNALCSAGRTARATDAASGMARSLFVRMTKPSFDVTDAMAKARNPGLLPHCQR